MLSKNVLFANGLSLIALIGFVVLFTDRSGFAWAIGGGAFLGLLAGSLAFSLINRQRIENNS